MLLAVGLCLLPRQVRKIWVKDILKRKHGDMVCARVNLREMRGKEQSHGEVPKILPNDEQLKTAKCALTWTTTVVAYERGEELC